MKRLHRLTCLLLLSIPCLALAQGESATISGAMQKTLQHPISPERIKRYYSDLDQDGVADALDECPNTPSGVEVDTIGCAVDSDHDGITDPIDQCPKTTARMAVNFLGCVADTDRDGVDDSRDQCPDTPLGRKVNRFGCEAATHKTLHLTFKTGEYALLPTHERQINTASRQLKDLEGDQVVLVEGHTDAIGCQDDNLRLSWNRAESVRSYLVAKLHYPADKVYVIGYGETRPAADNQTREERAHNRRIELKVVRLKALPAEARPEIPDSMRGYVRRPGRCPFPDAR